MELSDEWEPVSGLTNRLSAIQRDNTLLTTQARLGDPDLILGRAAFVLLALETHDHPVRGAVRCSGFLHHLHAMAASMINKSSVVQTPGSVR